MSHPQATKIDTASGQKIFFCTHVDDFAITATNPQLIEELCAIATEDRASASLRRATHTIESFLGVAQHAARKRPSARTSANPA